MDSREAVSRAREYMREHMKASRRKHTESVVRTCGELARRFGGDAEKAETAAWFHDLVRNLTDEQLNGLIDELGLDPVWKNRRNLSHGRIAAALMRRDYGIEDEDILNAVRYHTTGRDGMSLLEKIVFLADYIEPGRTHPAVVETRRLAEKDLDAACLYALEQTIAYVTVRGEALDPDTVRARDDLAGKRKSIPVTGEREK